MINVKVFTRTKTGGTVTVAGNGISTPTGNAQQSGSGGNAQTADEAKHALTADEATHAKSATTADNAVHADSASKADTAITANEAQHALQAAELDSDSPTREDFISAINDDSAAGHITFDKGATATELAVTTLATIARAIIAQAGSERFVDGFTGEGWQIWQQNGESSMTLDHITVRKAMTVLELLIERIRAIGGQLIVSAANGKIKEVEQNGPYYNITLEEGHGVFVVGDYVRCQTFTGGTLKSYWVQVAKVNGDQISVPVPAFGASVTPTAGDELVLLGNATNTARQSAVSISATEDGKPRIDVLNGITGASLKGCLRARLGDLSGISDSSFPSGAQPKGHGLYSDNAYLHGTFVLKNGSEVSQLFSAMDGKLQSVITEDWKQHNFLKNGWFLNGLLGWQDDSGTTPEDGGDWKVKTEDGVTYVALLGGTGTMQTMFFTTPPAEAGAMTLQMKVRAKKESSLSILFAYNESEYWQQDSVISEGSEWTTLSFDIDNEVSSFIGLMLMFDLGSGEIDVAQITLAAKQITRSEISQTAKSISLSVTEENNGKLKKAGIDIDKETVTISAAHTLIEDENGNPVAAFEGGKLKTAFLDLGTLNLSSDDIPMIKELMPTIDYEKIEGASESVALNGTNGATSAETLKFSVASFANDTASKRIYFSARASSDSMWLRVTETEVTVEYESKISDDLYKAESITPAYRGGGNWSFETDKPIRNLKITLTAKTLISTASSMEVSARLTLSIGGYQGDETMALVPLNNSTTITETVVGANGFASIWSSQFFFHLQANDKTYVDEHGDSYDQPAGCTIMAGDNGWRITAAGGLEVTNDRGLNWH